MEAANPWVAPYFVLNRRTEQSFDFKLYKLEILVAQTNSYRLKYVRGLGGHGIAFKSRGHWVSDFAHV